MPSDLTIVVLLSGRGSNFKSLSQKAKHYRIIGVVSDKPEAIGLAYAREQGVQALAFARSDHPNRAAQRAALYAAVRKFNPGAIALAGFMQILEASFVDEFFGRIINIHPSLLPAYPGLDTHARALAANERQHGCSVHFVDSGIDTGPIIAQAQVQVAPNETEEQLAARVLAREHELYPWVANHMAQGSFKLRDRKLSYSAEMQREARDLDFILSGDK